MPQTNIFTFASPEWLWLLVVVALLPIAHLLLRLYAKHKLRKFGNIETLNRLMPERSEVRGWIKVVVLTLASLFLVLALAYLQLLKCPLFLFSL